MFARQLANTSRRALVQARTPAARRGIHLGNEYRPYGVLSEIPPNAYPMIIISTAVTAVGLAAGVRTWLVAPEEMAQATHNHGVLRY